MNVFFHSLQWIVSLIAVAALCYLISVAVMSLIATLRKERRAQYALVVFVAGMLLAATFQRLRIGFWDWPDVEYQTEVLNENATAD